MSQETNQPSSTSARGELAHRLQGKLWSLRKLPGRETSDQERYAHIFLVKSAKETPLIKNPLLDLLAEVRACIREDEDPKRAWWLFFEAAFHGLKLVTVLKDEEYLLEVPKQYWSEGYSSTRGTKKEELLYLFTCYVASPPSIEFFEAMFEGWMYNLSCSPS